jgi:hypothetical protein
MSESPITSPKPSPRDNALCLSRELIILEAKSREQRVNLGDVMALLGERAYTFSLILLSLPFIQPIPIPGLSTPFGVAIALLGSGLLVGRKPWLPVRLLNIQLPEKFLAAALHVMRRLVRVLEVVLRPRIAFLVINPAMRRLQGFCILVSGLLLCLPLPLPFTNMLPAVTVITFSCSTLGRDGFFYLGGIFCFAITVAFFAVIGLGGTVAMTWIYEWLAENVFAQ